MFPQESLLETKVQYSLELFFQKLTEKFRENFLQGMILNPNLQERSLALQQLHPALDAFQVFPEDDFSQELKFLLPWSSFINEHASFLQQLGTLPDNDYQKAINQRAAQRRDIARALTAIARQERDAAIQRADQEKQAREAATLKADQEKQAREAAEQKADQAEQTLDAVEQKIALLLAERAQLLAASTNTALSSVSTQAAEQTRGVSNTMLLSGGPYQTPASGLETSLSALSFSPTVKTEKEAKSPTLRVF